MAKRVALLVGWTEYGDGRLIAPHPGATLAALAEALRQPQHGRFHSVRLLVEQTAVDAQLAIAAFLEQPRDPEDLLLLYLSGHCLFVGEEAVLAASDAFSEPYLDATTIQAEFLKRRLRQCPARAVLILDVVYSRADGAPEPEAEKLLERAFAAPEYALLLAARQAGQPEPPVSPTHSLAAGLRDLAAGGGGNGRFTLRDWFDSAAQSASFVVKQASAGQGEWEIVAGAETTAVAPVSPTTPPPTVTKRLAPIVLALLALLLLLFGGLYTLNNRPAASATSPTKTDPLPPITAPATAGVTYTATPPATPLPTLQPLPTSDQPTPTAIPQATPQATPTSDQPPATNDQPPPTITATPAPIPMEIAAEAAFLRSGPGINYRIISYPVRGTGVTAVARSGDATWYNVTLPDGQTGWIYTDVVRSDDAAAGADLPIAATIPAPANEFYDFALQDTGQTLIAQVYHVYVGTAGQEAFLRARLLPETDQVQPTYRNGTRLGFGLFLVEFARSGAVPYRSSQVEFCMVNSAGDPFFCQTFPAVREW
jgi:hypothetical protein